MAATDFRRYVPASDHPRLAGIGTKDARRHAADAMTLPSPSSLVAGWRERYPQSFVGLTTDGVPQQGLFHLADEGAPTPAAVAATLRFLAALTPEQARAVRHGVDAPEWRIWSNPELYVNPVGLRLEELAPHIRELILDVLRQSLSPTGFAKAEACMRMNAFLGELMGAPGVMNRYSYNFNLFGEPSDTDPWGWQFFGHHLVFNCLFIGGQMVLSPTFMGAEPTWVDVGPDAGLTLFTDEERLGLRLMQDLPEALQTRARIYRQMKDPAMPEGRWHFADQRLLGGAFHDNRVIPYEGVPGSELSVQQRDGLMAILAAFLEYLPDSVLAARLGQIEARLDETWFSWIGGFGDDDPFYYRVQSPVVMVEFDHKAGVWLTNPEPEKCHIHTVVRTPNGNDYGKDVLRQHYAAGGCCDRGAL
jgi:hypothetical protein